MRREESTVTQHSRLVDMIAAVASSSKILYRRKLDQLALKSDTGPVLVVKRACSCADV